MQAAPTPPPAQEPAVQLPVMLVAEVQDALLVVVHDLNRLDGLLAHTMENLMERFTTAIAALSDPALGDAPALAQARQALHAAVTELQFQDLAAQLIGHTSKVLQRLPAGFRVHGAGGWRGGALRGRGARASQSGHAGRNGCRLDRTVLTIFK